MSGSTPPSITWGHWTGGGFPWLGHNESCNTVDDERTCRSRLLDIVIHHRVYGRTLRSEHSWCNPLLCNDCRLHAVDICHHFGLYFDRIQSCISFPRRARHRADSSALYWYNWVFYISVERVSCYLLGQELRETRKRHDI